MVCDPHPSQGWHPHPSPLSFYFLVSLCFLVCGIGATWGISQTAPRGHAPPIEGGLVHWGPSWPGGGCSPSQRVCSGVYPTSLKPGVDTQLRAEPCCTLPLPPLPSRSAQAAPVQQNRPGPRSGVLPAPSGPLRQPPAGEQWPSAIPMPMLGRTLGAPSPPTHGPEHPSPGGLCRLSVPTSRPRQSVPAREKPPSLPQPSSPRASLPCPRQERGATFHGICISPGERGPQACGRSPQAECPGPPSWVPSSGSSLDTTE